ncbi:MAG: LysR family transcriptional regulator [Cyanobacteria bacterium]|nr:LysR family transcriptional regulator [Cyanobacteria bacterium GSL.Bin21]
MNLEYIKTFLTVARTKSFRVAARELGISQPSVSQHIKKLEESLNSQLIIRDRGGNQLTLKALTFLPYAESIVYVVERSKSALQEKNLNFSIGASSNIGIYILPPYLKRYLTSFEDPPRVELKINSNPQIADKLAFGEVDLAVMEWWDHRLGFSAHLWGYEELVLITPPDHPWQNLPVITKGFLQDIELLGGERGTGTGRLLKQYLGSKAETMQVSMQLGSTEAVKQAVQAGLGVSLVLADSVTQEVQNGTLKAIPIDLDGIPLRKELFLVWRNSLPADSSPIQFAQMLLAEGISNQKT